MNSIEREIIDDINSGDMDSARDQIADLMPEQITPKILEVFLKQDSANMVLLPNTMQTKEMVDNLIKDNAHAEYFEYIRKDLIKRPEFNQEFFNNLIHERPDVHNFIPKEFVNDELKSNIDKEKVLNLLDKETGVFWQDNLSTIPQFIRDDEFDKDVILNRDGRNIIYVQPDSINMELLDGALKNVPDDSDREMIINEVGHILKDKGGSKEDEPTQKSSIASIIFAETRTNNVTEPDHNNSIASIIFTDETRTNNAPDKTEKKIEPKGFLAKIGESMKTYKQENKEKNKEDNKKSYGM